MKVDEAIAYYIGRVLAGVWAPDLESYMYRSVEARGGIQAARDLETRIAALNRQTIFRDALEASERRLRMMGGLHR